MSPRRNRTTLGLLDTVVILVLAFTADLFLLWMASQILGLNLFEHLPGWLMALSKSIWSYVTGAASSILLGFLRRRINTSTRTPNYLLWSGGTAAAILLALTLVMSSIVRPLPVNGAVQTSEFTLKFYARPPGNADKAGQSQGSDLGPPPCLSAEDPQNSTKREYRTSAWWVLQDNSRLAFSMRTIHGTGVSRCDRERDVG